MRIEAKLEVLGLALQEPMRVPEGLRMPFSWVGVRADRAYVSGRIALEADCSVAGQLGKDGAEVSSEEGYESGLMPSVPSPSLVSVAPQERVVGAQAVDPALLVAADEGVPVVGPDAEVLTNAPDPSERPSPPGARPDPAHSGE